MIRLTIRYTALLSALGLAACEMEVPNENEPSRTQIKTETADLENFLGTQYRRWHSALYGVTGNVWGMANVMSFENFSTLSNNCQGQRVGIPRPTNDNQVGNPCGGEQALIYNRMSEVARSASDVLGRMNEDGFTFGTAGQDARNRAFAEFLRAITLGYLAMVYDSAAIISPEDPVEAGTSVPQELSHYTAVFAAALEAFDNALGATTGMDALPANWMFWAGTGTGTAAMPAAEFVRIVRSYRARIRASVARTPAERAAVDWDAVIADAQNGITADHRIVTTQTSNNLTGPNNTWVNQWYAYTTWHQMTPFIIGMGDTSGAYQAWLAEPLNDRGESSKFLMITPDQRFPQGSTRTEQRADFRLAGAGTAGNPGCSTANTTCERYFLNRDVADPPSSPAWGGSQYNHARHYSWRTAGSGGSAQTGPFPFFTKAELDLLAAEGHFRKGDYASAAALVNITRTACGPSLNDAEVLNVPAGCTDRPVGNGRVGDPGGGLPPAPADATTLLPGGDVGCVPKRPVNANAAGGGTVTCGTLWDALKWEKRLETAYTHFAGWFFDSRGWGDLVQGTPLDWAPPFTELQSRFRVGSAIYSAAAVAGPSTYGW